MLKIIKTASLNFYFSIVYFSFWLVLTELGVLNTWLAIVRFLVIKFSEGRVLHSVLKIIKTASLNFYLTSF